MRPSHFLRALLGVSVLVGTLPAHALARAAAAPATPPAAADEDSEARQLLRTRKYSEAAAAFERLYAASSTPRYLADAATARELAGHDSHAHLLWRRYLALPGVPPAELERVRARVAALERRMVAVRIVTIPHILASRDLELTIEHSPAGTPRDASRVPLVLEGDLLPLLAAPDLPGAFAIFLERGSWVIDARADGHEPARQEFSVSGGRAQVELAMPAAAPVVASVDLAITPVDAAAQGVELILTREGDTPVHERIGGAAKTWQLAAGTYTLSVRAAGYLPVDRTFTVEGKPLAIDLALVPEPQAPPPPPPKKRPDFWAIGLGATGGAAAVMGAVLLGVGGSRWSGTLDRYGQFAGNNRVNWNIASDNLFMAWTTHGAGAGLLGGGLGLGLGAVGMHFAPRLSRPKHLWAAGAAVGGVLAITGGLLIGRAGYGLQSAQWAHADRFSSLDASAADAFAGKNHHVGLSAALLGLGLGLGLSSLLGLVRKPTPRTTALLPTGTGLTLTGRF